MRNDKNHIKIIDILKELAPNSRERGLINKGWKPCKPTISKSEAVKLLLETRKNNKAQLVRWFDLYIVYRLNEVDRRPQAAVCVPGGII